MNPFQIATWIAIWLLSLGSIAVFIVFLVSFIRHKDWRQEDDSPPEPR